MKNLLYSFKWNWRELKKIITTLLKSWKASEIQRTNYCNSFSIKDNKIEKSEIKILIIQTENEENLKNFIMKNFPFLEKID